MIPLLNECADRAPVPLRSALIRVGELTRIRNGDSGTDVAATADADNIVWAVSCGGCKCIGCGDGGD